MDCTCAALLLIVAGLDLVEAIATDGQEYRLSACRTIGRAIVYGSLLYFGGFFDVLAKP